MTVLTNNFSGGPDGTTISTSNSGQFGDDAFDAVDATGTGQVTKFASVGAANLNRPTAEYALQVSTGSTVNSPYVEWSTSMGSQAQIWTRFYFYLVSLNNTSLHDLDLFSISTSGGGTDQVSFRIRTTTTPYLFQISNDNSGTLSTLGSTPVVTGEWARIEFRSTINSSGSADLYYYGGANVDTTTYTDSVSQASQNYGVLSAATFRLGHSNSNLANIPTIYFSNWELNNTGYPGPAPFRQGLGTPSGNLTNPIAIHMN